MSETHTAEGLRRWPESVRTRENGNAIRKGMRAIRAAFDAIEGEERDPFIAAEVDGMTVVIALGWRGAALQLWVEDAGGIIERKDL